MYGPSNLIRFIIVDGSTIREARDEEEQQPKTRKRQRVDDHENESGQPEKSGAGLFVHDPEYYHTSRDPSLEDCVVKVENTLFKIHRAIFPLSSTICVRLTEHGGITSDEAPLELLAATPYQFRALLWALYLPTKDIEARLRPTEQSDIDRLLALTTIAHKYSFLTLRDQSLSAILEAFTADAVFPDTCSSATFSAIVDLSVELKVRGLLDFVVTKWNDRIQRRDIPAMPAIMTADRHCLRSLRGNAYYVHIQETFDRQSHIVGTGVANLFADPKLSSFQTTRLLSGYMSLVTFWERLRRTPPKLPCAQGCGPAAHRACVVTWNEQWHCAASSPKTLRHNSADVLAILASIREQICADQELVQKVTKACRRGGLDALQKETDDLLSTLPDHFFGGL